MVLFFPITWFHQPFSPATDYLQLTHDLLKLLERFPVLNQTIDSLIEGLRCENHSE